jgi:hypothetical protein
MLQGFVSAVVWLWAAACSVPFVLLFSAVLHLVQNACCFAAGLARLP